MLALLEAASVSPNAGQYLPSISVVFESLAIRTRVGDKHADSAFLPRLLKAAHEECPSLAAEEDFLPHDPRFEVRVEWAGEMFRLVAGGLERPTSDIETLRRLAAIIDPVLHQHAKYGLADIVELVLRRIDAVADTLAPTWPTNLKQELGSSPQLSLDELAAAGKVPSLDDQLAQCSSPGRARAALEAHSVPAKIVRRNAGSEISTFGSTIAVRYGQRGYIPLPAGLMVEALNSLAGGLTSKALAFEPLLDEMWQQAAWEFVGRVFTGAGNDLIGPLRDERFPHLHSVIRYSDSQYLAIGVAAGLDHLEMQETIKAVARCLEGVRPGCTLRTVHGSESIPGSAKLCRLVIVAPPQAAMVRAPQGSKCALITLQDLDWIRRTIGRDEIDLWYFVRDRVEQRRVREVFAWDAIDVWETWKSQGKSLYLGAREIDVLAIEPHHSQAEWQKASEQSDIEMALQRLGLGRISAWPIHSLDDAPRIVGNALSGSLYQLVVCATPIAVSLRPHSGTEPFPEMAKSLGECITHKLELTEAEFVNLMKTSGLCSLRIEFAFDDSTNEPPLWVSDFENEVLTFSCSPSLVDLLREDSRSVEAKFGQLLAEAVADDADISEFTAAWRESPPAIRIDAISVNPKLQHAPRAISLHDAHRSEHLTELGAYLDELGIESGTYSGEQAKRLATETIFPWSRAKLHEELSAFDPAAVLGYALTQLECTNCHRWWDIEKSAYEIGSTIDDGNRLPESSENLLRQSRFISLIIEEILAHPPTGNRTPTEYEWQELLSFATLAGETGNQSEVIHLKLADVELAISDNYQVTISERDISTSIDYESFARDRRLAALPDPVPIGSSVARDGTNQDWRPVGERLPKYAEIEQSLQDSLGFGIDSIAGVLGAAIYWPVSTPQCTALSTQEQITADAHSANLAIPLASYARALEFLSLGAEDFDSDEPTIEHWEVESRAARIATRPFARDGSKIWVLPWTAEIALRIWVNNLSQHRLPIPNDELPESVVAALQRAQQVRQREFEDECASRLDGLPLTTVVRIRENKAHLHGIKHLSGEIDILSIDTNRSTIFVVEAKDPFVPLSARTVHRQVAHFHEPEGYVEKLAKKVRDVDSSAGSLAANKGVDAPDRDWQVVGIMVTRNVSPAAYVKGCQTMFCTVDTLRETIATYGS